MAIEHMNVLTSQWSAAAALERYASEHVPEGTPIVVKNGGAKRMVKPGGSEYISERARLIRELSDEATYAIMLLLYRMDEQYRFDMQAFAERYRSMFFGEEEKRWPAVEAFYPRLNQTALSICLRPISKTVINVRLERLVRIGWVERHTLLSPHPKSPAITALGKGVMDRVALDIAELMGAPIAALAALPFQSASTGS
jgi:hypothetical protein